MLVGTGLDLVSIDRIRGFRARWGVRGLKRVFSEAEAAYCLAQADPAPSLAARFAAKEAFFKALGYGWGLGGRWCEVEVVRSGGRAPELIVRGRAAAVAAGRGVTNMHVTLTHTAELAGAMVVLEA